MSVPAEMVWGTLEVNAPLTAMVPLVRNVMGTANAKDPFTVQVAPPAITGGARSCNDVPSLTNCAPLSRTKPC